MIALATVLAMLAAPDDTPLPSAEEVIARLEKTEAAIKNLAVTTEYVKLQQDSPSEAEPARMRLTTVFLVDRDGRTRYECVGEQVNRGPDGVNIYQGRWRSAYDGKVAASLSGGVDGPWVTAGLDRWPSWHGVNPLEFTTHYFQEPASKFIGLKGARVVGREERDSRPATVVEGEPVTKDGNGWKYRFWVDMERGVILRRAGLIQYPGQDWREYTRIESRGHEEIRPGIWLPAHVKYESLHTTKEGGPEQISWSYEGRNLGWEVNRELPEGAFRLDFPPSATVSDRRRPNEK